jgi:hypothetical protein
LNPLILNNGISIEVVVNVDAAELEARTQVCQACSHFSPSRYESANIVNATTGQEESVLVYKYEDCDVDNISLTGFLTFKSSICPEGKW